MSSTELSKKPMPNTITGLLADDRIKQQMALALPKHMTAERLARIALTEVRRVPKLRECDQASFMGAIMQCASLGLEPGQALGHAYLLPFKNRRKGITEVQFIIGYRGMLDLARRSGQIHSIESRAVYESDDFEVTFGLDSDLKHVPSWDAERGQITHVYAVAKLKDGGVQFEVMSLAQVEAIRKQSKSKDDGPWVTHFEEMARKTVIRRLFKYLPVSIQLQEAVGLDEMADAGMQHNRAFIDAEYETLPPDDGTDQPELPEFSPEDFKAKFAKWQEAITSGKRTADDIIAMASTVGTLSESQRAAIYDCAPVEPAAAEAEGGAA